MPAKWLNTILGATLVAVLVAGCTAPATIPSDELSSRLQEHNMVLMPEGEGPFPAVLLLHSCYGNLGHVDAWAAWLRDHGYVAVVVNSMQARELDGHFDRLAVCAGRALRAGERSRDLSIGIERLRRSHVVDRGRIGIVGFSHGGWTALDFLSESTDGDAVGLSSSGLGGVRSVVVVYPYCGEEAMEGLGTWPRDVRVMMLLAGNDTTVGTAECQALAREQIARGFSVDVHIYAGAKHGYDIDPALIYGYDQRYDESAARDTRERIIGFLRETLMGGSRSTGSSSSSGKQPPSPGNLVHVQNSNRRMW
jgi:dienelactone hydrolase